MPHEFELSHNFAEVTKIICCAKDGDDGGARSVMVIVVENGHGDKSSNPGRDWLHFT